MKDEWALFYDADVLPLSKHGGNILTGLVGIDIIFLAQGISQTVNRKNALFFGSPPQPRRGLVETQQTSEINGIEPFTCDYILATHVAQHKSFL